MSNDKNNKVKNRDITGKIKKGISVVRAALDIYVAIKRKDPIYTGMSMLSTYEALETLFTGDYVNSVDKFIKKNNLVQVDKVGFGTVLNGTFMDVGIPRDVVLKSNDVTLYSYNINNEQLFVRNSGTQYLLFTNEGVDYIKLISNITDKYFGEQISISYSKNYDFVIAKDIKINSETYINTVNPDEYKKNIINFRKKNINRSSVLSGLPGSGKTTFCSIIAKKFNGRLLLIPSATLTTIVDYEIDIQKIIDIFSPSVVLFDDLDRVQEYYLNDLLGVFDNLDRETADTVIMSTVNNLDVLPKALKRPGRIDEVIEFDYPTDNQRDRIIKKYLEYYKMKMSEEDIKKLVELTKEMMPAFIKEVVIQSTIMSMDKMELVVKHIKKFQT
jgi:adenylate kinase family enzyme